MQVISQSSNPALLALLTRSKVFVVYNTAYVDRAAQLVSLFFGLIPSTHKKPIRPDRCFRSMQRRAIFFLVSVSCRCRTRNTSLHSFIPRRLATTSTFHDLWCDQVYCCPWGVLVLPGANCTSSHGTHLTVHPSLCLYRRGNHTLRTDPSTAPPCSWQTKRRLLSQSERNNALSRDG